MMKNPSKFFFCHCKLFEQSNGMSVYFPLSLKLLFCKNFVNPFSSLWHHPVFQVIQREPWEHIKDDDIKKAAASFCGEIWQVPPMFSAIKVKISCFILFICRSKHQ